MAVATEYEIHPICRLVPAMREERKVELTDSLRRNGLRVKGWLYEGKCLDGRSRAECCGRAGVTMEWQVFEGTWEEAHALVADLNLIRRDNSEAERRLAVSEMVVALQEHRNGGRVGKERSAMAAKAGVPETDVYRGEQVVKKGVPELLAAVKAGEVAVSAAALVAELPEEEQRQAVKSSTVPQAANTVRAKKKGETKAKQDGKAKGGKGKGGKKTQADAEEVIKDQLGNVVPRSVRDTFGDKQLPELIDRMKASAAELKAIKGRVMAVWQGLQQFYPFAHFDKANAGVTTALEEVEVAVAQLEAGLPYCVCPKCKGERCPQCQQSGVWPKHRHMNVGRQYGG